MPLSKKERQTILDNADMLGIVHQSGWNNFTKDYPEPNALVLKIETEAQLQAIMKCVYDLNAGKTANKNISLRAAAGGQGESYSESYSFTDCARADVMLHLVGKPFLKIDSNREDRAYVGASAQIGDIDKTLYEKHNLTLPTSSLIPYVTAAGLSANAGHGTGKDQPSFAGLIQSMRVCLPNGEIATLDASHPNFETIRAAHMGLFGVVIDMELKCIPAQKLKCTMDVNTVDEFITKTKNGLFKQYPYVSAMYVPCYDKDERKHSRNNVIVYAWEPVDRQTPDHNNHADWLEFSQHFMIGLTENLNVMGLMRHFPSLIPYYMRYFVSKVSVGNNDSVAIGPWHEIAHYQNAFPTDLHEYGALFPVSDAAKDGVETPEIVAAFEKLVDTLTALAKEGKFPLTYAAYLRYFQGTNGGLSISGHPEGHHICGMDMTTGHNIKGFPEFQQTMSDYCTDELHAKPHWGKNAPPMDFKKLYGERYNDFSRALVKWHNDHGIQFMQSPLVNDYAQRVLGMRPPEQIQRASIIEDYAPSLSRQDTQKACKALLDLVTEDSEEAQALRRELQRVITAQHTNGLLSGLSCLCPAKKGPDQPAEQPQPESKCVIM